MRRLRKPVRVDHIKTEVRRPKGSLGKWIYLGLLGLLLLWLLDLFFGRYLYLQANGIVTRDIHTVGLSYNAQIKQLDVHEGMVVAQGAVLGEVVSMDIIQQLSALTMEIAAVDAKRMAARSELAVIDATLDMAKKRATDMAALRAEQERAVQRGLTSTQNISELLQDEFDSQLKYTQMRTRYSALREELNQLKQSYQALRDIYQQTSDIYQQGRVMAAQAGIVANVRAHAGAVVKPGDKILDILHGPPYVLAYLDPDALYTIAEGDKVSVLFGAQLLDARVSTIYPLSTELPKEFQRTFRPLERSTVVRIELLDAAQAPPIFTTVELLSSGSLLRWLKAWL